jgi:hypothetical protein
MKRKVPQLSAEERKIIRENLMHDLAGLDATTEEEAEHLYERLVAEGHVDPAASTAAHERLLTRLGVAPDKPRVLTAAECLRAYEEYRKVPRAQVAQELGIDLATLSRFETDQTALPREDQAFADACRKLAQRIRARATAVANALRLGRMRLSECIGEPAGMYARKEDTKKP